MSNVVRFARVRQTNPQEELERVLLGALAEVRAGRLRSLAAVAMDAQGREYILVTGAYRVNRRYASNAGFMLQTAAADSSFG